MGTGVESGKTTWLKVDVNFTFTPILIEKSTKS